MPNLGLSGKCVFKCRWYVVYVGKAYLSAIQNIGALVVVLISTLLAEKTIQVCAKTL